MFLHIGNGQTVKKKEILGIFDLDTASVSPITRDFLSRMQKDGKVTYPGDDIPRSFLVLREKDGECVKLSRISPAGLKTRSETPQGGAEE